MLGAFRASWWPNPPRQQGQADQALTLLVRSNRSALKLKSTHLCSAAICNGCDKL